MFREPICAVTVCLGYDDFLRETVRWNARHFDQWTIVTRPDDKKTREICRQFKLHCLTTRDDTRDGEFSKGRLVERGLQHLPAESWIVHMDADIVLPTSFRHDLHRAHLEPEKIYGIDRIMVPGWEAWQQLQASNWLNGVHNGHPHAVVFPRGYPIGARWAGSDGYVPIGFFQMWHRIAGEEEWRGARVKSYPLNHGKACRTDVQHALSWDRRDRAVIPEILAAHLESEAAPVGTNWRGRRTARFGPETDYRPSASFTPS